MNKVPLIVGNWKMHKTCAEAKTHLMQLSPLVFRSKVEIWLAVPFTDLSVAAATAKGSNIQIGAQNMSDLLGGALTGEISAPMIVETGASFVILGHSERRRIFYEDGFMINRKVKLALRSGLKVILCIGESLEQRDAGKTEEILKLQLEECLKDVSLEDASQLVIAYEPVWAIGSRRPATPEIVEKIHHLCKTSIASYFGLPVERARVLYGGSVNAANAKEFLSIPTVDGLLVGGASLDVASFAEIVHQAEGIT